ncbi:MAG: NAD(P)-dependent oxidoreductase, partial [Phycisphaerales bacterium]|nr:NAD(P)-dependent oxidoreductase [Phycisphaerales bacterium]
MRIALTGATGFLGRYLLRRFCAGGHDVRAWARGGSDRAGVESLAEWIDGELGDDEAAARLVRGCDSVVHAALFRPGEAFRGQEGDIVEFADKNVLGTLRLIRASIAADVERFVFI